MLLKNKLQITKAFLEVIQEEINTSVHIYEKEPLYPIQKQTELFHDILTIKIIERENAEKLLYKNIAKGV